jgi:hypothetical protein
MKSKILELKLDYTGSINILNEIMKGTIISDLTLAIDEKYGKNNPIYLESSRKKGEAILHLTHSISKQPGYSDLSTNSRSSLNNTFLKLKPGSCSKRLNSKQKLKRYVTISTEKSSKRRK